MEEVPYTYGKPGYQEQKYEEVFINLRSEGEITQETISIYRMWTLGMMLDQIMTKGVIKHRSFAKISSDDSSGSGFLMG
ncbi:hypothetical protein H0W26_02295 [Candidatus Dependentiae bacterium]|nr:hypothetical protein [Candidatus Dependentiae bacterium]